ncbi:hypothetical protein BVC80_9063g100 [Macleaya cordata]|uniref:Thionin-like protein 2 n=1 Tax=Macleaya cordata TaxID=56857 RepID=A0A200PND9_MACCD|nr:hypothetical protein BVC80_9063g100 [Macleaya cordata]
MEGKSVKPIGVMLITVVLMLGMFVGPATAKFHVGCYAKCFLTCAIGSKPTPLCAIGCLAKYIYHSPASTNNLGHHYCQMGCASSKCINISTPQHPRAKEVGVCVDSCPDKCTAATIY